MHLFIRCPTCGKSVGEYILIYKELLLNAQTKMSAQQNIPLSAFDIWPDYNLKTEIWLNDLGLSQICCRKTAITSLNFYDYL